jgi:hypothetical protein
MPLMNQSKMCASIATVHAAPANGPLDICKTPAPPAPAPVPMPYPNVALSSTPGPGYTTKTLSLATPMWTKKGKTLISNGDQPGVALGIKSNKIMGMCEIIMASNDVFCEGGAVVRTLDKSDSNG